MILRKFKNVNELVKYTTWDSLALGNLIKMDR